MLNLLRTLLLIGLAIWAVRVIWRWLHPPAPAVRQQQEQPTQALSRCSRCGTLIPQQMILWHQDKPFCSSACRDA
ncbi:PP0621 family protein [Candidatus Magnetaquicoccus inordinatus]|uniref:PP0621 family protein n=1 Tax=Candidatus Magnetaquicoccus inordinatus TaxID=2496818 RepID=UPI00102D2971|nr:PP0621 family protein [Candidatus Magnetaquicoccus inordinatus]